MDEFVNPTYDLLLIIKGRGTVELDGVVYEYGPKSLIALNAFDTRTEITLERTEYMCVRYLDTQKKKRFTSGVYKCFDEELYRMFLALKKEHTKKRYGYFEYCNLTVMQMLIVIARMDKVNQETTDIYRVIQSIDESQGVLPSIKEMAEEASYSYDHFRHKFKQITGQSPTNYIINKRIENACRLLTEEGYNCTEVSILCGFSSPAEFSALFKKKMGTSPKNIRK